MPFDRRRLLYALAGDLLTTTWNSISLDLAINHRFAELPIRPRALYQRLITAFPQPPAFHDLVAFLAADAPFWQPPPKPRLPAPKPPLRLLRPVMQRRPAPLANLPLPDLPTQAALADWLRIPLPRLLWLADTTGRNRRHPPGPLRAYRYRWIPRRHGPPRLIEIPKAPLKALQRTLLRHLLYLLPVHPAAHAFVPGRSTLTNAAPHCAKALLLKLDLQDFFPSVTAARIFRLFRTLGYPAPVARLLMGLCTTATPADIWDHRPNAALGADFPLRQRLTTRHLPQGAPTSPALANLAAFRLDRRLSRLASILGAAYTRYADDLAFSGDALFARRAHRLPAYIDAIARDEGFLVNHHKTRSMRPGIPQHLTGLTLNVRPNLPRHRFDRLKAILTNCIRHGPDSQNRARHPHFRAHLQGQIAHLASIHPTHAAKLHHLLSKIQWPPTE